MVYEWDNFKDECYRLYITERKSLEDIMQHMKETHQFAPSKRAFQTQFKRWNFPSKQNPAHRNVDLVTRVKELWEQNYSQRDMLRTLNEEGFQIKERELMRVRAKNRWLLRIPNGQKATPAEVAFENELLAAAAELQGDAVSKDDTTVIPAVTEEVPEEVVKKRKERHEKMQAESDERWAAKKRRRRTRDYAGIPADPPGPPRFPSELTLGESMQNLSMIPEVYKEARMDFQRICEDENIIKKTLAGTDKWAAAKRRLIEENAHLNAVFADPIDRPGKELALDVICTDVTKRMRTVETRMTIVDAKNILTINPEQSRQIRDSFYRILQNDHFTSKLETGPDHWNDLKEQWIQSTPMLQEIMREDQDLGILAKKKKALEVLCRDVMKRLRDAQKRDDGTSIPVTTPAKKRIPSPSVAPPLPAAPPGNFELDMQIDPSLLQPLEQHADQSVVQDEGHDIVSALPPIAVYVRPHTDSDIHAKDKMFLTTLAMRTYTELEQAILSKWPDSIIAKLQGVTKAPGGGMMEFPVDGDDELYAYLEHVAGSKVVFVVHLNRA
ncbi:hypothetical protein LTR64_007020 [Lithohypha guttulata]|uniref:Clr5 domain-containing protein n=1 Tax=Lithohypha guttulata TaxID=1690604 RepID=A0AAN7T6A0_9EURO|nr:hypothetical protein LTR51_004423 [Lithohypha guttulata]KAK5091028.1 hypothetical protein LTR05_001208 [Lithohypha guttulata]